MTTWFRRLADVPGVAYAGAPGANGQRGSSPASLHARVVASPQVSDPSSVLLGRLHEALELPGTTADYHFAIQGCVQELWKRRRREPHLLPDIERLCWLDIRLLEAQPETITFEREGGVSFARVIAFGYLIEVYRREGFLVEALEAAERGARVHQTTAVAELRKLVACIEAEDA